MHPARCTHSMTEANHLFIYLFMVNRAHLHPLTPY